VIGFAAGLAKEGFIPFINTIGTFISRRAYEQICVDVALHNLPVRLLAGGGGMVYAPLGPTHTSIEDLSLMLSIPGLQVFAPADAIEMKRLIDASIRDLRPYYIRFGKGGEKNVTENFPDFDFGPKVFGSRESNVVILTTGVILHSCLEAQKELSALGIETTVVHFPYLNDLPLETLADLIECSEIVVCAEEHVPRGGLMTQVLHSSVRHKVRLENLVHLSLPQDFSHNYGSQEEHLKFNNLHADGIVTQIYQRILN
jgi:transketolase